MSIFYIISRSSNVFFSCSMEEVISSTSYVWHQSEEKKDRKRDIVINKAATVKSLKAQEYKEVFAE